jgi:hypothetical protein
MHDKNRSAKLGAFAIVPAFGVPKDLVFDNICHELKLTPVSPNTKRRMGIYLRSLPIWVVLALKLLFIKLKLSEVHGLKCNGVSFGSEWSATQAILSTMGKFSINVASFRHLFHTIYFIKYWDEQFRNRLIGLVLGGTENYIYFSVLMKQAVSYGVPAFSLKSYKGVTCFPYAPTLERANPMPEDLRFAEVTDHEKTIAEEELAERCKGNYKSLDYMALASPSFNFHRDGPIKLSDAFVICAHDIFDSPNLHGEGLFVDHFQWLDYTLNLLLSSGWPVVVKWHPNAREKCVKVHSWFENKYRSVTYISGLIPVNNLLDIKPRCVITQFGSITVEATYKGLAVISTGKSIYEVFGLGFFPKSIKEYSALIRDRSLLDAFIKLKSKQQLRDTAVEALARLKKIFQDEGANALVPFDRPTEFFQRYTSLKSDFNWVNETSDEIIKECVAKFFGSSDGRTELLKLVDRIKRDLRASAVCL